MRVRRKNLSLSGVEKTLLGRVLEERPEQVFCHDSALALEITVEVYLDIFGGLF